MGSIKTTYKIMFESQKKRRRCGNIGILHTPPSKGSFKHKIHSLLRRADARGSVDIIYPI